MTPRESPRAAQRQSRLIGRALAHVESHLNLRLDASVLADRAAMSRHHFHRVFHAHVGLSVGEYLTWRPLQRACALLISGTEPVADIAGSVGYESAQALAKAIRRELDASPTQVRRGHATVWTRLLHPTLLLGPQPLVEGDAPMQPDRYTELPASLAALTATARGMVGHNLTRAAQQAFGELLPALGRAGLISRLVGCPSASNPRCRPGWAQGGMTIGFSKNVSDASCGMRLPMSTSRQSRRLALCGDAAGLDLHTKSLSHLAQGYRQPAIRRPTRSA